MKRKLGLVGLAVVIAALAVGILGWLGATWQAAWAAEETQQRWLKGNVVESGDTITVETGKDEIATLLITDTTRLWIPGQPPTTTVSLAVGDPVLAMGQPVATESHRALLARVVVVVSDEDLPKILVRGRIVAVTEKTIVVQTGRGERAMTVFPRTRLWSAGERLNSVQDVHPGEQIVALGQPTELGQWIAGLVMVRGQP
jgi:hypothetical protein